MGKKSKQLYQMLMAQFQKMNEPKSNPAQEAATNMALEGAEVFRKGEYSAGKLPKGTFFNFEDPIQQLAAYKKYANVNQGGTFALGDSQGMGRASEVQNKYLQDRFARDASSNYQANVAHAADQVNAALQQASNYQSNRDAQILNALQGLYTYQASKPSGAGGWLQMAGRLGSAAINKW